MFHFEKKKVSILNKKLKVKPLWVFVSTPIYRNQWTGFYIIGTYVMKELNQNLKNFEIVRYCTVKYSVLSSLNIYLSDLSQFRNYVRNFNPLTCGVHRKDHTC